jgi:hypothetical protein
MRRLNALAGIVLLATATTSFAQKQGTVDYRAVSCIRGGEMATFQMSVKDSGTLRSYFRRVGATDWCSVDGTNRGQISSITMPKFEDGEEIEYYFAVINGKEVVAKSPQIYRVKANASCETPIARHVLALPMECLPAGKNPIADSLGAGYAFRGSVAQEEPRFASPDRP